MENTGKALPFIVKSSSNGLLPYCCCLNVIFCWLLIFPINGALAPQRRRYCISCPPVAEYVICVRCRFRISRAESFSIDVFSGAAPALAQSGTSADSSGSNAFIGLAISSGAYSCIVLSIYSFICSTYSLPPFSYHSSSRLSKASTGSSPTMILVSVSSQVSLKSINTGSRDAGGT